MILGYVSDDNTPEFDKLSIEFPHVVFVKTQKFRYGNDVFAVIDGAPVKSELINADDHSKLRALVQKYATSSGKYFWRGREEEIPRSLRLER